MVALLEKNICARDTQDGRRFLRSLWLIASSALLFSVVSVALDGLFASGSSFEDGAVWIYDIAIYGLAAISFGRGAVLERATAALLAVVLLVAGCQGSYDIWCELARKLPDASGSSPVSEILLPTGSAFEAALLFRFRKVGDPLMQATWLSARNSAAIALIGAALPLVFQKSCEGPEMVVACLDTFLAFQAALIVAYEAYPRRDASSGRLGGRAYPSGVGGNLLPLHNDG